MKHLTIIAGVITSISSYSLAMQYKPNFNNNLSNDTIIIFDIEGREPCIVDITNPLCSIGPKKNKSTTYNGISNRDSGSSNNKNG